MKRKVIILLTASLVLTFGSVGTVFADEPAAQTAEDAVHEHTWGSPYYVVDKDAEYENVTIVDTPEHKVYGAQLYTQHDDGKWYSDGEIYWFENSFTLDDFKAILADKIKNEAYIGNYLNLEKTVPAVTHEEYQEVSPEEGHNEHVCTVCGEIQDSDTGKVIKPGTLPEEPTESTEPSEPAEPAEQTEQTEQTNTSEPAEQTNTNEPSDTEYNTKTVQTADRNEQNSDNADTGKNSAPQTGDSVSLLSFITLAGSIVTGGTAFGFRRKSKRL